MSRFQSNPKMGRTPGLTFVAFDIIRHKGEDLRSLDLMTRKSILEKAIEENEVIKRIRYMEHSFIPLFELCKQQALEGIVIKSEATGIMWANDLKIYGNALLSINVKCV